MINNLPDFTVYSCTSLVKKEFRFLDPLLLLYLYRKGAPGLSNEVKVLEGTVYVQSLISDRQ